MIIRKTYNIGIKPCALCGLRIHGERYVLSGSHVHEICFLQIKDNPDIIRKEVWDVYCN